MDFELMINSFPKLLNATVITLKLLSASLFFDDKGQLIEMIKYKNGKPINEGK